MHHGKNNKLLSPLKKVVQQMSPNREAVKQRPMRGVMDVGVDGRGSALRASEIEEQMLLAEIDKLNLIQRRKMEELRQIEMLEQQRLRAGGSHGPAGSDGVNGHHRQQQQQQHQQQQKARQAREKSEQQLLKEKEKKAFGWGARDVKPRAADAVPAKRTASPKRKKKSAGLADAHQQQLDEWQDAQRMGSEYAQQYQQQPSGGPGSVHDNATPHYPVAGGFAGYGAGDGYMNVYAKQHKGAGRGKQPQHRQQPYTVEDAGDVYSHVSAYNPRSDGSSQQQHQQNGERRGAARLRGGVEETVSLPAIPAAAPVAAAGTGAPYQHPLRNSRRVDSREKNRPVAPDRLREENERLKQQLEQMQMMHAAQKQHQPQHHHHHQQQR